MELIIHVTRHKLPPSDNFLFFAESSSNLLKIFFFFLFSRMFHKVKKTCGVQIVKKDAFFT